MQEPEKIYNRRFQIAAAFPGCFWSPDQRFLTICDNQNHEAYVGQATNDNSKNKLTIVDYELKRS